MTFAELPLTTFGEMLLDARKRTDSPILIKHVKDQIKHNCGLPLAWQDACLNAVVELKYRRGGNEWEEIAGLFPERPLWIGPSNHLQWKDGLPVLGFGMYAGQPLHEIATEDIGYLEWVIEADFPQHITQLCQAAIQHKRDELVEWIIREFGPPPANSGEA